MHCQVESEMKSMFIRYISHEIRNPLNSVQLGLDCLKEDMIRCNDHSSRLEILRDVTASLELSLHTLDDMLTGDKIRSGFLVLDKKKVSILQWLANVMTSLQLQVSIN